MDWFPVAAGAKTDVIPAAAGAAAVLFLRTFWALHSAPAAAVSQARSTTPTAAYAATVRATAVDAARTARQAVDAKTAAAAIQITKR